VLHLKLIEKQKPDNYKTSKRREIIKIGLKRRKQRPKKMQRINETKSRFFKKIHKMEKTLANLAKMRREKTQTDKIRNEEGKIKTKTKEIQGTIRDYFEKCIYSKKLEN
jgi:thymidylate synthase